MMSGREGGRAGVSDDAPDKYIYVRDKMTAQSHEV